jgi:hypothetical protein
MFAALLSPGYLIDVSILLVNYLTVSRCSINLTDNTMVSSTNTAGEDISCLIAQYFELVDLKNVAIPSSTVLKTPSTQQRIYDGMFNEELLSPIIPPATYRLRVLKQIITRIENDQQWDPEEDV